MGFSLCSRLESIMIPIKLPARILISGATACGKTFLLSQMLLNREKIFDGEVSKVIFCAMYETSVPKILRNQPWLTFHQGCPTQSLLDSFDETQTTQTIVVVDDLLENCFQDLTVLKLFTQVGLNKTRFAII